MYMYMYISIYIYDMYMWWTWRRLKIDQRQNFKYSHFRSQHSGSHQSDASHAYACLERDGCADGCVQEMALAPVSRAVGTLVRGRIRFACSSSSHRSLLLLARTLPTLAVAPSSLWVLVTELLRSVLACHRQSAVAWVDASKVGGRARSSGCASGGGVPPASSPYEAATASKVTSSFDASALCAQPLLMPR